MASGADRAVERPRFSGFPFSLGVASGAPLPDGVVLWTRLAPEPLRGGGAGDEPVAVAQRSLQRIASEPVVGLARSAEGAPPGPPQQPTTVTSCELMSTTGYQY